MPGAPPILTRLSLEARTVRPDMFSVLLYEFALSTRGVPYKELRWSVGDHPARLRKNVRYAVKTEGFTEATGLRPLYIVNVYPRR